ncbi:hypothetical protein ACFWAP_00715 [Streptomyces goshikiensis]|uniref:hypothetical protein n=1 Tax=Streptomyces goshikiensis TaxID=1942 RepID=UPI0036652878
MGDDDIWGAVPGGELPTRDPAEPLRRYFKQRGVHAQVVVGDGVLKLILASAQDARRLTEIVVLSMPPERKAAVRLREVFFAAGIGRRVDGSSITSDHGYVNIGDLDVQDALRLWRLIWGGAGPEEFDPYDMGWQRVEHLAERMEVAVSEACGGHVGVDPNAACNTCSGSRNDQITLGLATPEQANRLATRIEAAATPTGTAGPT